jgi:hypothetical protein
MDGKRYFATFLTPSPKNHINHKNHSLDDGGGSFSVFLPNFK